MEEIKILFFIVGTFFGVDQSRVVSETTTVTINPEEKTIVILQENLISLIQNESDSSKVQTELKSIALPEQKWSSELKGFSKKEKCFYISDDTKTLNSKISLTYKHVTDLKVFGIDKNKDGKFSMTNFPKSYVKSKDGKLGERYWTFESNKPFSFTEEPLTDMPEEYRKFKQSLLPFWKILKH